MKTVTARASFELSCPQDQLELTVLSTEGARKLANQIGVTGCGQKVVYVYFSSTDTWTPDSAITPAMTQREEAYKEQKARQDQAAEEERRFEEQQSYQRGVTPGPGGRRRAALRGTTELPTGCESVALSLMHR
jgi:hypothetical protein